MDTLRSILGSSADVTIRRLKIGRDTNIDAAIIYIDGLVDKTLVNQDILHPLMYHFQNLDGHAESKNMDLINFMQSSVLTVGDITAQAEFSTLIDGVLSGKAILLLEGSNQALAIDVKGWKARNIEEAKNELAIRGPREGFNETLRTNTAMLRRIIRDPRLTFDTVKIGERTKTDVTIAYVKGICQDSLIEEIKQRLNHINTDAVLDIGYVEQFIEDNPLSLFSTIGNTERPDVAASKILEGRAAILVDGSPFALTVPMVFAEGFQNPEDYYARPFFATFTRFIRLLAFLLSVYLPAFYVSLMSYHQELFPTPLMVTVAAAKEGMPFPVVVEALFMILLFEILREAGLRMPRTLGQAVSIVGALVIGQSAVSAGLVGAPMVVVLATTAIASFVSPTHADLGALFRFLMTIAAGFIGIFGITVFSIEILSHLASLRSFGVPYLSPITPLNISDLKDVILRAPFWTMKGRPQFLGSPDPQRQSANQMPSNPLTQKNKQGGD